MPALLILALAAGLAAPPPASATPAANSAKPDKDAVVCTSEIQLDSRFRKRVCMTNAERDERARLQREHISSSTRSYCTGRDC
jgi:hypothetical protein